MYSTYVIESVNGTYRYTGISDNVERRIRQHNKGYNRTTKPYAPFKVILIEEFPDRASAREREKQLKSGYERERITAIRGS